MKKHNCSAADLNYGWRWWRGEDLSGSERGSLLEDEWSFSHEDRSTGHRKTLLMRCVAVANNSWRIKQHHLSKRCLLSVNATVCFRCRTFQVFWLKPPRPDFSCNVLMIKILARWLRISEIWRSRCSSGDWECQCRTRSDCISENQQHMHYVQNCLATRLSCMSSEIIGINRAFVPLLLQ